MGQYCVGWRVTLFPSYVCRIAAALLVWLALVLWGSVLVAQFPLFSQAVVPGYRALASILAPFGIVWSFWAKSPFSVLLSGLGLALVGGLLLALRS